MSINSDTIVVIPTMNRATIITTVLDAILNQTLKPDCLVVVDDGSTDNSVEVIRNWQDRTHPPFETKLIVLPYNMGVSVARNIGLAQARNNHRYVYFLDSDNMPSTNFLQQTTATLNQYPNAIAVSSYWGNPSKQMHIDILDTYNKWFGCASNTLFRSDSVRQLNGFNEARLVGEDWDFVMRIILTARPESRWLTISGTYITALESKSHLSTKDFPNILRQNTYTSELFIDAFVKKNPTTYPNCRHKLAHQWKVVGMMYLINLHYTEARDCFRRSLSWNAFDNKKALFYLMFTLSFSWFFTMLNKLGLYNQFKNGVKRVVHRFKLPY